MIKKNLLTALIFLHLQCSASGHALLSADTLLVKNISIEGNFITGKRIILRELAFKENEVIERQSIEYLRLTSVNNLTRTLLFNFADVDVTESEPGFLTVRVTLTERWFIWPTLYLNHTAPNFSEWWRTKDISRLEYGVGLKVNNLRGMGETLILNYRIGNFTRLEFEYRDIVLDRRERHSLTLKGSWLADKMLPYIIESDREVLLKEDYNLQEGYKFSARYKFRKGYFNSHKVEAGYSDIKIADTISMLNPFYAGLNNLRQSYFSIGYEFMHDNRDSRIYPKTGNLIVAGINKKGLGLLKGEANAADLYAYFYSYHKISGRIYFASGLWYSSSLFRNYAFSLQTGLGYLNFVRGYEYYAVNGNDAFLFRSLLKYEILPEKVINMRGWPIRNLHQFNMIPVSVYAGIFFDAGYVNDRYDIYKDHNNILVNKMMYSTGLALDFVTYYDKVFRLDYSFNALGESGLFIHWKAAFR